jgi:predicted alpha/beta superfamily hydrolase
MHDGQNLFDPSQSFTGVAWNIQGAMDTGAGDASIAEAIVVGIENTANRLMEYTPVADPTEADAGGGGDGAQYIGAIISELKPKIDSTYRTIPDRDHTFMAGSSLGGLISAYAGVEDAATFGAVGVMSPSTWWDNDWVIGEVGTISSHATRSLRVYLDSGDSGPSNDDVTETAQLSMAYQNVGYVSASTLDYLVQTGGQHSETYWAERAPGMLAFVIGPRDYHP